MSSLLPFCIIFGVTVVSKPLDWLINDINAFPTVSLTTCSYNGFDCIELSNGLISRKFIIKPNFFTIEYNSYLSSTEPEYVIRSPFSPEAIIGFNYKNYSIGGVSYINNSNTTAAFWNKDFLTMNNIKINETTWLFNNYSISTKCNKIYEWIPGNRHSFDYIPWPPQGLQLNITFKAPINAPITIRNYITITVMYEMYRGIPLLSKQVVIQSSDPSETSDIYLTYIQVEQLKTNIPFGVGEESWNWGNSHTSMVPYPGLLWIETDYAHSTALKWFEDPDKQYFESNNYGGFEAMFITYFNINNQQTEWSVRFAPELPGTENGIFKSFRTFELFFNNFDLERQGLARKRFWIYMSPTLTESPIYTQTINMSNGSLYEMIDQCYETGFEMLAFSFDSGFNMETTNQTQLDFYSTVIEYANSQNIEIGGYDLIDMARNFSTLNHYNTDGLQEEGACFASDWYDQLIGFVDNWIDIGGTMFITDGPYPGFSCAYDQHKHHDNLGDSVYRQIYLQNQFYLYFHNKNIYIHSPDSYYYYGINRNKYPYNEYTTTLPRWWDLTIYRQLMYDNSYRIPVTAGWMFLPMTAYHGGNQYAVFEPLYENINDYSFALGQYFSYSVAATIRGNEIYDRNETKYMVRNWVNYYKKYRNILMSDIIHIQRPTNLNVDAILHVNHLLINQCGMLIIFNPLNQTLFNLSIDINLYYTGAKNSIYIAHQEKRPFNKITLYDEYYYTLNYNIPARNLSYWIFDCSH